MKHEWNKDEIACVKRLAKLFEKNNVVVADDFHGHPNDLSDPLKLRPDNRDSILTVMEQLEVITEVVHSAERRFSLFHIDAKVVQVAREIAEQERKQDEPRDIVEEIKTKVRSTSIAAWAIIAFILLVALVNLINGVFDLLQKFGAFKVK